VLIIIDNKAAMVAFASAFHKLMVQQGRLDEFRKWNRGFVEDGQPKCNLKKGKELAQFLRGRRWEDISKWIGWKTELNGNKANEH